MSDFEPPDEQVETVARAIYEVTEWSGCAGSSWPHVPADIADRYRRQARAVLAAVGPMIAAGALREEQARIASILDGIDRSEDDRDGWWETTAGAKFGADILASIDASGSTRSQDATEADPAPPGPNDT